MARIANAVPYHVVCELYLHLHCICIAFVFVLEGGHCISCERARAAAYFGAFLGLERHRGFTIGPSRHQPGNDISHKKGLQGLAGSRDSAWSFQNMIMI